MPIVPGLSRWAGMTPILHAPGEIRPWELGPISRVLEPSSTRLTRTMSSTGTRSVTQTASGISALIASIMASAALAGGTKIALAEAPVSAIASATLSNTGKPRCLRPPLPGTTPPTTLVP